MPDDIGTVRWFGPTWGAPVNDPRAEIPTPINRQCIECGHYIAQGDAGIRTAASREIAEDGQAFYHLACFSQALGLRPVLPSAGSDEGDTEERNEFYGYR